MFRTYTELSKLKTFEERYEYLKLTGKVGQETFGHERHKNQKFYRSKTWRQIRAHVITRDLGRDLGIEGYEIYSDLLIHHMNPLTIDDIVRGTRNVVDPEFLITTSLTTHNDIHYGANSKPTRLVVERKQGDTTLW